MWETPSHYTPSAGETVYVIYEVTGQKVCFMSEATPFSSHSSSFCALPRMPYCLGTRFHVTHRARSQASLLGCSLERASSCELIIAIQTLGPLQHLPLHSTWGVSVAYLFHKFSRFVFTHRNLKYACVHLHDVITGDECDLQ